MPRKLEDRSLSRHHTSHMWTKAWKCYLPTGKPFSLNKWNKYNSGHTLKQANLPQFKFWLESQGALPPLHASQLKLLTCLRCDNCQNTLKTSHITLTRGQHPTCRKHYQSSGWQHWRFHQIRGWWYTCTVPTANINSPQIHRSSWYLVPSTPLSAPSCGILIIGGGSTRARVATTCPNKKSWRAIKNEKEYQGSYHCKWYWRHYKFQHWQQSILQSREEW